MDLASLFAATPNATPFDALSHAWHWSLAPGMDFVAGLTEDGKHAFQGAALDSYDAELAVAILAFARDHASDLAASPDQPLALVEGFMPPAPYKFDAVVTIGPKVHRYQEGEAHERTRAIIPAFRCEFAGDENEAETQYRYARAAGVPGTRWNREPRPFVKMRYLTESGREIPERGFTPVPSLVIQLRDLQGSDRFVEFENYRHEVYRVDWDGQYVVSGESSHRFNYDELLEFVKNTVYGPNVDAGTSEFRDHN